MMFILPCLKITSGLSLVLRMLEIQLRLRGMVLASSSLITLYSSKKVTNLYSLLTVNNLKHARFASNVRSGDDEAGV